MSSGTTTIRVNIPLIQVLRNSLLIPYTRLRQVRKCLSPVEKGDEGKN